MTKSVMGAAMMMNAMATGEGTTDYVGALDANSLDGKRVGVARFSQGSNPLILERFNAGLAVLEAQGAVLVDIEEAELAPQRPAAPLGPLLAGLRGQGLKLGVATNDAEAPARAHLAQDPSRIGIPFGIGLFGNVQRRTIGPPAQDAVTIHADQFRHALYALHSPKRPDLASRQYPGKPARPNGQAREATLHQFAGLIAFGMA